MKLLFSLALILSSLTFAYAQTQPQASCEEQVKVWRIYSQEIANERERAQIQVAALRVMIQDLERQLAESRKKDKE